MAKLKVKKVFPLESGTSKNGKDWVKIGLLCETDGTYPSDVYITFKGKNDVEKAKTLNVGHIIETTYQPESREFNGRWYTELKCWGIEVMGKNSAPQSANEQEDDSSPLPF